MTVTDIDDVWFGNIGIVVIEDDLTKERKAYIGVGGGVCKEADMEKIKSWGMPVSMNILKELCRVMEPEIETGP
jgi:hypothetical protein